MPSEEPNRKSWLSAAEADVAARDVRAFAPSAGARPGLTIADTEAKAPVYDEMSRTIRNRFKAKNLTLRSGIRVRGRRQASRQE